MYSAQVAVDGGMALVSVLITQALRGSSSSKALFIVTNNRDALCWIVPSTNSTNLIYQTLVQQFRSTWFSWFVVRDNQR